MTEQQRFPLSWPAGWPRTSVRRQAPFCKRNRIEGGWTSNQRLDIGDGLNRLNGELRRLGASQIVVSSNLRLNIDGSINRSQASPGDVGVAVYFKLRGGPRVLACDRWTRIADNLAAIAGHIEAIRACDRYGVGTLEQAFAGYAALPANTAHNWRAVFGLGDDVRDLARVDERYRELARTAHPDVGGSHDAMARLSEARVAARQELGA